MQASKTELTAAMAILLFLALGAGAEPVVDIPAIAGKSSAEVEKALGSPGDCSEISQGRKCIYRGGDLEIVFIDGRADWITTYAFAGLRFSEQALTHLGLGAARPAFKRDHVIRWESIQGLREVSLFSNGRGGIHYAYIKARTE